MANKVIYTVLIDGLYVIENYKGESYEEAIKEYNFCKKDKTCGVTYLYKNKELLMHN